MGSEDLFFHSVYSLQPQSSFSQEIHYYNVVLQKEGRGNCCWLREKNYLTFPPLFCAIRSHFVYFPQRTSPGSVIAPLLDLIPFQLKCKMPQSKHQRCTHNYVKTTDQGPFGRILKGALSNMFSILPLNSQMDLSGCDIPS